ncbi:MAG: hypothetical protein HYS38_07725 [Acidobacteria bacterium]|nr:hypothetical protein [Acidobacteriota bacterium]
MAARLAEELARIVGSEAVLDRPEAHERDENVASHDPDLMAGLFASGELAATGSQWSCRGSCEQSRGFDGPGDCY